MPYKVAVLMGGSSFEREFSLASGRHVLRALEAAGHQVLPLDTTALLVDILRREQPDVAYIALHGKHGEDSTIQSLLEFLDIPYVGSTSDVCRFTWNKSILPYVVTSHRLPGAPEYASWPQSICLPAVAFKDLGAAAALDLVEKRIESGYPLAVKPASGGSAMGITKVENFEGLAPALLDALSFDDEVLIESWVEGVELAVCVVGAGDDARVLPPIEICPKTGFFNTEVRLDSDLVDYYAPPRPASLSSDAAEAARIQLLVEQAALEVHRGHGCRDLSRVDLIWDGEKPRILEINVSPGMTEHSLFPMACKAAGIDFGEFLEGLLEVAIKRS
jgi:D-alanine-D-alanine ligase